MRLDVVGTGGRGLSPSAGRCPAHPASAGTASPLTEGVFPRVLTWRGLWDPSDRGTDTTLGLHLATRPPPTAPAR